MDMSSGISILVVPSPIFSLSRSNSSSKLGMVGRKKGADLGTVKGVFGLFLRLTTSMCSRLSQREVGWLERVMSCSLSCSGDVYSGSSPSSMNPMSSMAGFSGAVVGSSGIEVQFNNMIPIA